MKKLFLIALLLGISFTYAQDAPKIPKNYNQWSIEANYGIALPTGSHPVDFVGANGYISSAVKGVDMMSFNHFDVGLKYMFNQKWGTKLSFAHEKFKEKDIPENNLVYTRINAEVVANLMALFNSRTDDFGFFAHGGAGLIWGVPSSPFPINDHYDHLGNIMLGVNPVYKISEKFALSLDLTYTLLLKQHYAANGQVLDNEMVDNHEGGGHGLGRELKPFTGGFFLFSAGIKYYLGKHKNHADWL